MSMRDQLPLFWTVDEVAEVLRTSRKAVYLMAERGLLPEVTKVGRRTLFRADLLVEWLDQKRAPSRSVRISRCGARRFGRFRSWRDTGISR
jgi:excisionase family DNA binding protein